MRGGGAPCRGAGPQTSHRLRFRGCHRSSCGWTTRGRARSP